MIIGNHDYHGDLEHCTRSFEILQGARMIGMVGAGNMNDVKVTGWSSFHFQIDTPKEFRSLVRKVIK